MMKEKKSTFLLHEGILNYFSFFKLTIIYLLLLLLFYIITQSINKSYYIQVNSCTWSTTCAQGHDIL